MSLPQINKNIAKKIAEMISCDEITRDYVNAINNLNIYEENIEDIILPETAKNGYRENLEILLDSYKSYYQVQETIHL